MERIAYSIREAARLCGIPAYHLRNAARAGEIKVARVGVRLLVTVDDLKAWLATKEVPHVNL